MLKTACLKHMSLLVNRMFQNNATRVMPAYWALVPVIHTVNGVGIK